MLQAPNMFQLLVTLVLIQSSFGCPYIEDTIAYRSRLPKTIKPISYSITVKPDFSPDMDPAPFHGSVDIRITPIRTTANITLHSHTLQIRDKSVSVVNINGTALTIRSFRRDRKNQFYIIILKEQLQIGNQYQLSIGSYDGILLCGDVGFYLATYMEDGIERRFATTQFESTHARKAFPCFDEPEYKATFIITVIRPTEYISISNEALLKTTHIGNNISKDVYQETVNMSTYLVAIVVCQYDYIQKDKQRVFARPQAVRDGWCEYALQTGLEVKKVLEDYLQMTYVMSKLDQIAIPDIHSPGAMENWGLITYRESFILFSQNHSTSQQLLKICTVIAHEFSHQWFGNLVTLHWWENLWLNEGFATYFEFLVASLTEPTWRLMEQFIFSVHDGLYFDSLNFTTPMSYEGPSDSGALVLISYDKAASVIRMMEHVITQEIFRQSLKIYLTKNEYSTSTPNDLYFAFQAGIDSADMRKLLGGHNMSAIMAPWVEQVGYPVVTVTRNYNTGIITLNQRRFMKKGDGNPKQVWPIPINFMFSAKDKFDFTKTTADIWFTSPEMKLHKKYTFNGFVIANKQQTGFYRVNYDLKNWNKIIKHLTRKKIADIIPVNRAQLIDDSFNLAKMGLLPYNVAFDLSCYISREDDYIPLVAFLEEMDFLRNKLGRSDTEHLLNGFVLDQLKYVANQLTVYDKPTDSHVTKLNRVAVMTHMCIIGDELCRSSSLDAFKQFKSADNVFLSPDMQEYVFCSALSSGNKEYWDYMYSMYLNEKVEFLKMRMLKSLGCSGDQNILINFIDRIVDTTSFIRKTDRHIAFESIYNAGTVGLNATLMYMRNNFKVLVHSPLNLQKIIIEVATKIHTQNGKLLIKDFVQDYGNDYFEYALKIVNENVDWNKKYAPSILKWLRNYTEEAHRTRSDRDNRNSVIY